ncbi:MAG: RDD family protein [Pseudomonadota bacterium]
MASDPAIGGAAVIRSRLSAGLSPKLQRRLVTPEGVTLNIHVAGAGARLGALLLDLTFLTAIYIGYLIGLFALVFGLGLENDRESGIVEFLLVISIIFLFLLRNGYFLAFELGPRGATWGKRIIGIRVAARDGGRLAPEAVIARNLIREVEIFLPMQFLIVLATEQDSSTFTLIAGTLWVLVFATFLLFNRDRLRCGDLLAGTWVVMAPKQKLTEVVAPRETMVAAAARGSDYRFTDEELGIYGEYELQALEQVLRDGSEESERTVYVTICNKLGWEPGEGDERAFLENYYTQLRQRLESGMRFGKRRADKFDDAD